jgi:hypothetical protein
MKICLRREPAWLAAALLTFWSCGWRLPSVPEQPGRRAARQARPAPRASRARRRPFRSGSAWSRSRRRRAAP